LIKGGLIKYREQLEAKTKVRVVIKKPRHYRFWCTHVHTRLDQFAKSGERYRKTMKSRWLFSFHRSENAYVATDDSRQRSAPSSRPASQDNNFGPAHCRARRAITRESPVHDYAEERERERERESESVSWVAVSASSR
jgi:hypothetical protein